MPLLFQPYKYPLVQGHLPSIYLHPPTSMHLPRLLSDVCRPPNLVPHRLLPSFVHPTLLVAPIRRDPPPSMASPVVVQIRVKSCPTQRVRARAREHQTRRLDRAGTSSSEKGTGRTGWDPSRRLIRARQSGCWTITHQVRIRL